MASDDELARYRTRVKLFDALDDLGIEGRTRDEMIDDPARALDVLERARQAKGVRNLAAFIVARWRRRPVEPEPEPEFEPAAPTLADLEHVWRHQDSAFTDALVAAMGAVIVRKHGTLAALKPSAPLVLDDDAA